jgi:hypothetical protein
MIRRFPLEKLKNGIKVGEKHTEYSFDPDGETIYFNFQIVRIGKRHGLGKLMSVTDERDAIKWVRE